MAVSLADDSVQSEHPDRPAIGRHSVESPSPHLLLDHRQTFRSLDQPSSYEYSITPLYATIAASFSADLSPGG